MSGIEEPAPGRTQQVKLIKLGVNLEPVSIKLLVPLNTALCPLSIGVKVLLPYGQRGLPVTGRLFKPSVSSFILPLALLNNNEEHPAGTDVDAGSIAEISVA